MAFLSGALFEEYDMPVSTVRDYKIIMERYKVY
jgi:hypothetical protein